MDFEVIATGYQFAEAPRAAADGSVYFSDLFGGGYYRARPNGAVDGLLAGRKYIGGAVLGADGALICSGLGGLIKVGPDSGLSAPVLTHIEGAPIIAINDVEAAADGGIFGGSIDFVSIFETGEKTAPGQFFYLSPQGAVRVLREVTVSNGIAFSPDGQIMYHAESTKGVWACPMAADGMPGAPSMFAALEDCDGLAVDVEGGLWVARWQAAELRRYRPDAVLDRCMALPFAHVTSLAFGGPDLTALYVTVGGDQARPGQGGLLRLKADVPGLPVHRTTVGAGLLVS
ncbi:MAG: hypothetical protein Tsb0016_15920 [Sphingomonadales bacterium]